MKTRVFLIRHGETLWNREQRCQGFTDIDLSEKGAQQAERLARYLARISKLEAVYSSDLIRARKTAEAIARRQGLVVKVDSRLRELNQGEIEGKNLSDLATCYPEILQKWLVEPADVEMPGGESLSQLQQRAWKAFSEITERHQGSEIAIVAHNLCNITIICKLLELDLNHFRRIKQSSGALNEIELTENGPVIIRLNDTHFLE